MEKILIKFRSTEDDFIQITWYKDNINCQINVTFYYLSNETNPRFVTITVLEFKPNNLTNKVKIIINW